MMILLFQPEVESISSARALRVAREEAQEAMLIPSLAQVVGEVVTAVTEGLGLEMPPAGTLSAQTFHYWNLIARAAVVEGTMLQYSPLREVAQLG